MNEIHDNLAPIAPVFFTVFDWVVVGVLFVGIGVILWFLFVNRKRDAQKEQKIIKEEFIPEPFVFEKELKRIAALQTKQEWKDFSLEATALLKRILEQKYKTPFDFATGREIQEIMANKNISDLRKQELKYFFQLIDPIKFANASGKDEIAKEVINILTDFNKK